MWCSVASDLVLPWLELPALSIGVLSLINIAIPSVFYA
jgi:hypothetical protein